MVRAIAAVIQKILVFLTFFLGGCSSFENAFTYFKNNWSALCVEVDTDFPGGSFYYKVSELNIGEESAGNGRRFKLTVNFYLDQSSSGNRSCNDSGKLVGAVQFLATSFEEIERIKNVDDIFGEGLSSSFDARKVQFEMGEAEAIVKDTAVGRIAGRILRDKRWCGLSSQWLPRGGHDAEVTLNGRSCSLETVGRFTIPRVGAESHYYLAVSIPKQTLYLGHTNCLVPSSDDGTFPCLYLKGALK